MKKIFLPILLVLTIHNLGVFSIFAQEQAIETELERSQESANKAIAVSKERERRHVIWLAPELSYTAGLDEGFSLFPRDGLGLGAHLGYDYRGRFVVNELSLGGKYIWLDAPYKLPVIDLGVQIKIADRVLVPINLDRWPLVLYVGGAVRMDMNVWFPQNRLNSSYQTHLALDAMLRLEWEINNSHTLRGAFSLPLLGVSWRPAWAAYTTEIERSLTENGVIGPLFISPKFASVHNLQSFTLELRYTWNASRLINLFADYSYMLLYDSSARPYNLIDNVLKMGMEFKL